jgi:hypothetical protein
MFTPRQLADGRICCSDEHALCATCHARFAKSPTRLLRTAADILANPARDFTPPNPHAATATSAAAERAKAMAPDVDPAYRPHGQPADPYQIGLAVRQLEAEDAAASRAISGTPIRCDTNGTPDPYATALVARR